MLVSVPQGGDIMDWSSFLLGILATILGECAAIVVLAIIMWRKDRNEQNNKRHDKF